MIKSADTGYKIIKTVGEYAVMTIAVALMAAGIYLFKYPNDFVLGGLTGLSVIVGRTVPGLTPATFVLVSNIVLILIGFLILGNSFSVRTIYCSLLLSGLLKLFETVDLMRFLPLTERGTLTDQPFLELFFAVFCTSLSAALIFDLGGSTGGSDIIAMIIRKFAKIEIGKALLAADLAIVLCSFFVFDVTTSLFSLFGVLAATLIIDTVIENINLSKYFTIITSEPAAVSRFITRELERGATEWDASGSYTGGAKKVIITVVNRSEARKLRGYVRTVDPDSFITITNISDIIGKGFRSNV